MSMFMCAKCDNLRDSDDGCAEAPSPPYFPQFGLLCIDCMNEEEDQPTSERNFTPEQQAIIDAHEAGEDEQ